MADETDAPKTPTRPKRWYSEWSPRITSGRFGLANEDDATDEPSPPYKDIIENPLMLEPSEAGIDLSPSRSFITSSPRAYFNDSDGADADTDLSDVNTTPIQASFDSLTRGGRTISIHDLNTPLDVTDKVALPASVESRMDTINDVLAAVSDLNIVSAAPETAKQKKNRKARERKKAKAALEGQQAAETEQKRISEGRMSEKDFQAQMYSMEEPSAEMKKEIRRRIHEAKEEMLAKPYSATDYSRNRRSARGSQQTDYFSPSSQRNSIQSAKSGIANTASQRNSTASATSNTATFSNLSFGTPSARSSASTTSNARGKRPAITSDALADASGLTAFLNAFPAPPGTSPYPGDRTKALKVLGEEDVARPASANNPFASLLNPLIIGNNNPMPADFKARYKAHDVVQEQLRKNYRGKKAGETAADIARQTLRRAPTDLTSKVDVEKVMEQKDINEEQLMAMYATIWLERCEKNGW